MLAEYVMDAERDAEGVRVGGGVTVRVTETEGENEAVLWFVIDLESLPLHEGTVCVTDGEKDADKVVAFVVV